MRYILTLFVVSMFALCSVKAQSNNVTNAQLNNLKIMQIPPLQRAVLLIKRFEAWHDNPRDPNYIGWGHRIQPHEKHLNQNITRAQGDSLLIEDLCKLVKHFKYCGKDALLISCLAYNCGTVALEGNKSRQPSKLIQKIRSGNRDFKEDYVDFCRYRGKIVKSIKRRRELELMLLYQH